MPVRISAKTDYALRATAELAAANGDGLVKADQIAQAQGIPLKFLLNILNELKQELKISPDHLPSILQIAFEYLRRSDWDAARPWAQRAVELDPRDFTGRRALGQVLLETGSTAAQ